MKLKCSHRWNDIKWCGKELNGMESIQMERNDMALEGLVSDGTGWKWTLMW